MQHVAQYMIGKTLHATCCMMLHELERDSIPFAVNIINRCFY